MGTQGLGLVLAGSQLLSAPSALSPGTELLCIPCEHCFSSVLNVTKSRDLL